MLEELAAKREASGEGRGGKEGREARAGRAAAAAEEAEAVARAVFTQAQAEGLRLRNSDKNATGFSNVHQDGGRFRAKVSRGSKTVHLGSFGSAEEAALQVAAMLTMAVLSMAILTMAILTMTWPRCRWRARVTVARRQTP